MGAIQKVNYEAAGQMVELTQATVKQYLVSGNGNVTDQEVGIFLMLCKGQKLNPFLREAYLVKFGTQPAQIVVGKDAFTKRAESNKNYKGSEAGIIVVNLNKQIENRKGTFYLKGREELVGGWAKVLFKDGKEEMFHTVGIDEYNTGKSLWATKPATMIRKVALVQALREAFPNALSQMYTSEELGVDEELPMEPVDPQEEQMKAEFVEPIKQSASKSIKQQVMQLAKDKGLMKGEGREANIEGLMNLCKEHGINLKSLMQDEAEKLLDILMKYEVVHDVPEEDIKEAEVESDEVSESVDEDEPF